ncbi:MAG: hypothetical protein Q8P71_01370 [bacterium]|nr:hypothetical protein [bacterium]
MASPGQVRGIAIKPNWEYLFKEHGEKTRALESEFERLGYPFSFDKISPMQFYPIGHDVLFFVLAKQIFNLSDEEFFQMGVYGTKTSFFLKIAFRYFISPKSTLEQVPSLWKKYYTVGDFSVEEMDMDGRRVILHLSNFSIPHKRNFCHNLRGYLATLWSIAMGTKVLCEEVLCAFEDDSPRHIFVLTWGEEK